MAELQTAGNQKHVGVRRSKKLSTRVDLTPMVDLGFLLITFFIFTTTLSQARTMKLVMPDDRPVVDPPMAAESKTISFLLGEDNKLFYYPGLSLTALANTDYSARGLRKLLEEKKAAIIAAGGKPSDLIVLIKPTDGANFKNLVAVLDEILINDIKKYVLMEPSRAELDRLAIK